jgi:hypothetical protein
VRRRDAEKKTRNEKVTKGRSCEGRKDERRRDEGTKEHRGQGSKDQGAQGQLGSERRVSKISKVQLYTLIPVCFYMWVRYSG